MYTVSPSGIRIPEKEGGNMRIAKLMLVCVCLAGLTQLVWSQSSSVLKTHERGIPGFLDPKTGMFTARVQSQEPTADVTPSAVTTIDYTGTWTFIIHITVSSVIPSTAVITCEANLSVTDIATSTPLSRPLDPITSTRAPLLPAPGALELA
jgi:hypothetical protein